MNACLIFSRALFYCWKITHLDPLIFCLVLTVYWTIFTTSNSVKKWIKYTLKRKFPWSWKNSPVTWSNIFWKSISLGKIYLWRGIFQNFLGHNRHNWGQICLKIGSKGLHWAKIGSKRFWKSVYLVKIVKINLSPKGCHWAKIGQSLGQNWAKIG